MKKHIVVGTRNSKLALQQTDIVIKKLRQTYPKHDFEVKTIKTTGDSIRHRPLNLIGGKGLFVKEIEQELLAGTIDIAVHSAKDLPGELEKGLVLGAVLEREDARDAFVSFSHDSVAAVPEGGKVGTGSLRRRMQLLLQNDRLTVVPIRGNVETRIKKLKTEGLDGIVLAFAGIKRLGFEKYVRQIIPVNVMTPACGQGAIGIEVRDEKVFTKFIAAVNDERSFREVSIERDLLARIGGGCHMPVGIHSAITGNTVKLYISVGNSEDKALLHNLYAGNIKDTDALVAKVFLKIKNVMK